MLARTATDLLRILQPASAGVMLGSLLYCTLNAVGATDGAPVMALVTPLGLLAAGMAAVIFTVLCKWLVIGRYRRSEHPYWSFFVWQDEVINSLQEQLAGAWLLGSALATPLMSLYLRAMGARVGKGVWCETMALTEFDMVTFEDGAVVNWLAVIETHLFHNRLLRIAPTVLRAGATLGPSAVVPPDTKLGAGCTVGARSVVMRGRVQFIGPCRPWTSTSA